MDAKLKRCREKEYEDSDLDDKQLIKKIKAIDAGRKRMYEFVCGGEWGNMSQYNLCVNTSGVAIKDLSIKVADYAKTWFECQKSK